MIYIHEKTLKRVFVLPLFLAKYCSDFQTRSSQRVLSSWVWQIFSGYFVRILSQHWHCHNYTLEQLSDGQSVSFKPEITNSEDWDEFLRSNIASFQKHYIVIASLVSPARAWRMAWVLTGGAQGHVHNFLPVSLLTFDPLWHIPKVWYHHCVRASD